MASAHTHSPAETATAALFATALMMAALLAPSFAALLVDERMINAASVWDKPLKFELSLIVHLVTLGLLVRLIAPETRAGQRVRVLATLTCVSSLGEVLYIALQAARGRASHFNTETPAEIAMYALMGVGAVTLVVCAFAFGVLLARSPRDGLGPGLKLGATLGLTIGAGLTLVIAGLMSTGMVDGPGHWVGGVHSDAHALPLFGWSTTGGDLRAPHFFATHAMQALPLAGLAADAVARKAARVLVTIIAIAWIALVGATFAQALLGRPFLVM